MDPGKFDDWLEANKYLLKHSMNPVLESDVDSTSEIAENVSIGKNTTILRSKIKGPSVIGDNVVINDSDIGSFTSIADNCEISNSRLGNSVLMSGVKILDVQTHPIDTSLIGTESEVIESNGQGAKTALFIGEKCKIQI